MTGDGRVVVRRDDQSGRLAAWELATGRTRWEADGPPDNPVWFDESADRVHGRDGFSSGARTSRPAARPTDDWFGRRPVLSADGRVAAFPYGWERRRVSGDGRLATADSGGRYAVWDIPPRPSPPLLAGLAAGWTLFLFDLSRWRWRRGVVR